jgi:hypothetical protein
MRYYNNGSGFTVSYTDSDADDFSYGWPGSSVDGKGFFEFASNGDLVGCGGSASDLDGVDWSAFAEDCKNYGIPKYTRDCRKQKRLERLP